MQGRCFNLVRRKIHMNCRCTTEQTSQNTKSSMCWLLTLVVWTVMSVFWLQVVDADVSRRPHIVFVFADDFGFHDIGYHGSNIKTPNLDELAEEGVKLENYYVQPICSPSRAQFLSGRYSIHTGMLDGPLTPNENFGLPLDHPTLADKLTEAGYATHLVGKWHLGHSKAAYLPINRGFDTFYGFYLGAGDHYNHTGSFMTPRRRSRRESENHVEKRTPASRETQHLSTGNNYAMLWKSGKHYLDLHDQDRPLYNETGHYSTHLFTEKAIEKIRGHDPSKPLFLYLAHQAIHWPIQVPEHYLEPYHHIRNDHSRIYAGMVAAMDEGIGNLTQALKDAGLWNNTVFVFSTDNGGDPQEGANNYPLKGKKNTFWEGGIRGIGFVRAPGLKTAGTVSKALIDVSDWYPTFVGLAGGVRNDTMNYLDGYDQWKAISEGVPSPRDVLCYTLDPRKVHQGAPSHNHTFDVRITAALRSGDWKILTGAHKNGLYYPYNDQKTRDPSSKMLWLYNVTADPTERSDLSEQFPEVVTKLLDLLADHQKTVVLPPDRTPDLKADPALHGGVFGPWL